MSKLYKGAKISDYRFRRIVELYAKDITATDAARSTRLSVNTVHSVYRKLRVFFHDVRLFRDYYGGGDPVAAETPDPTFEKALVEFHLRRIGAHRGLKSPSTEPHYHFAETCWRYDFALMMDERPSDAVYGMMTRHLLELIRLCGPVGGPPRNLVAGVEAVMRQTDERIEWFRRNAPAYRDEVIRDSLKAARDIA